MLWRTVRVLLNGQDGHSQAIDTIDRCTGREKLPVRQGFAAARAPAPFIAAAEAGRADCREPQPNGGGHGLRHSLSAYSCSLQPTAAAGILNRGYVGVI